MSWWWPFRRRLEPIKPETREHDRRIVDLDRALALEHRATRLQQRRLDRFIQELGEQFETTARQVTERIVHNGSDR
jgi:hypothetical protein